MFLIQQEQVGNMARNLKALVTKHSFKERYKTAQTYLQKLRFLTEDVSSGHYKIFYCTIIVEQQK
jgi:hypothetical protein